MTTAIPDDDALLELVYAAIDEYNASATTALTKTPETALYGGDSTIDSLGLVHLIIALEQNVFDQTGLSLALAADKAFSPTRSPFRDVVSLVSYLRERLQEGEA
ncbi:MAG: acyl carrier protein [Myxococcaceae bacterium]|nr:acyl carrier protein [Myxococcaceae bacterium]